MVWTKGMAAKEYEKQVTLRIILEIIPQGWLTERMREAREREY